MSNVDSNRVGILLAGGAGTRLYPMTLGASKQLLTVYSKPLVYYPLSVLMLSGIREVVVITTPEDQSNFVRLLGDGSQWGMRFHHKVQERPAGIAQSFLIAEELIAGRPTCLVLGDNLFYGADLTKLLRGADRIQTGATVFAYEVEDPERYGVVEFEPDGKATSIEEKPSQPKSNYAVTGLYFYDKAVLDYAKALKPSSRGELEITDVNNNYLQRGELNVVRMRRGYAWLDTGTPQALLSAAQFVAAVEQRQGTMIACLEEIALRLGWLSKTQLLEQIRPFANSSYGSYLKRLVHERNTD